MTDLGKCDVCRVNDAVGVCSTSMPMSVAYCTECARRGADPEIVFICWFDDFGADCKDMNEGAADGCLTFKDGKYITYREWAKTYKPPDISAVNSQSTP